MTTRQPKSNFLSVYRYYDPAAGRWLSRDPLAERGGLNLYSFCKNAPLSIVDPLGLTDYLIVVGEPGDAMHSAGRAFQQAAKQKAVEIETRSSFDKEKDKVTVKYFAVDEKEKKALKKEGVKPEQIVTDKKGVLDYLTTAKPTDKDKLGEVHFYGHAYRSAPSLATTDQVTERMEGRPEEEVAARNDAAHIREGDIKGLTDEQKKQLASNLQDKAVVKLWGCNFNQAERKDKGHPETSFAHTLAETVSAGGSTAQVYGLLPGASSEFIPNPKDKKSVIGMHISPTQYAKDKQYWEKEGYKIDDTGYMNYSSKMKPAAATPVVPPPPTAPTSTPPVEAVPTLAPASPSPGAAGPPAATP